MFSTPPITPPELAAKPFNLSHRTPIKTTHIRSIPPDLQPPFLRQNRTSINKHARRAVKDEELQSTDVTRAVFYYQLDPKRQFRRGGDVLRWNVGIFVALLAACEGDEGGRKEGDSGDCAGGEAQKKVDKQPKTKKGKGKGRARQRQPTAASQPSTPLSIPPSAIYFIKSYLAAVQEHHNTPSTFTARDAFIKLWKNSRWDMYTYFASAQRKVLKREGKRLSVEWGLELDRMRGLMGQGEFERRVGRFVGSLIPGVREGVNGEDEVLDSLKGQLGELKYQQDEEVGGEVVASLRVGIAAVQRARARDMLEVLMRLFPGEYGE